MSSRKKFKKRRGVTRRQTSRTKAFGRGFEFGALFRLCQIFLAAFLLYITASLFAIGVGVLGEDMSSCILRFAGGGVVIILLHFFYGLFCSLLRRQVSSVCSQWLGTFCLYVSLSLFLGMLRKIGLVGDIGLLSPGIFGLLCAEILPRFIGAVGAMLVGLCLVCLSAFYYGHLTTAQVARLRECLSAIRLPSRPAWLRRKPREQDEFPAEEEGGEFVPDETPDDVVMNDRDAEGDFSESDEPESDADDFSNDPAAESKPAVKKPGVFAGISAALVSLLGRSRGVEEGAGEEADETMDENPEDDFADPEDFNETPEYDDDFPGEREDFPEKPEELEELEDPAEHADSDQEAPEFEEHERPASHVRPSAFFASDGVSRPEESRRPAAAGNSVPVTKKPSVEIDPSGALSGTEDTQFIAGREIPANTFPPPLDLLGPHQEMQEAVYDQQARENGEAVISSLADFGVSAELKRTIIGPTVVQYQIQLAPGIKVSKVSALGNDIAVALGVSSIRVEAPIPGTSYIGIELPNSNRRAVPLRQILESDVFKNTRLHLPLPLGQTVDGRILISGLEELPHLLIAGTTGSGKSIFVNNCIVAMCYHNPPTDLRFIMVDPKRVEMGIYESLPHILAKPIVTAPAAVHALAWAVREMDRRYDACSQAKVRSIASYNEKVLPKDRMPHIVIIVDELADLMMTAQKEVEEYIMRLAQMARAVGIHLMLATQRPSVNVLTGTIKANIPARVSFSLPSIADSRTILDVSGAQNLLGKGDMLFVSTRHPHPLRIQSPFIDEQTNIRVVEYLRNTFGDPEYVDLDEQGNDKNGGGSDFLEDSRLEEAIKIVLNTGVASSSGLQRQMRVGFTRAARMIDTMESMGIVGPQNGAKPREILVDEAEALEILDQYREG